MICFSHFLLNLDLKQVSVLNFGSISLVALMVDAEGAVYAGAAQRGLFPPLNRSHCQGEGVRDHGCLLYR